MGQGFGVLLRIPNSPSGKETGLTIIVKHAKPTVVLGSRCIYRVSDQGYGRQLGRG